MSRISATFDRTRADGRVALMPYATAGYPTMEICEQNLLAMVRAGADLIEIGTPFSDPMADGTTVQKTSQVSLDNGTKLKDCVALVKRLREQGVAIPLMLMGYYNPILRYGIDHFASDAAAAGVDGLIVPDLSLESSEPLRATAEAYGIDLIFFLAPTSTDERIQQVARIGTGFIYCVSVTGVTGARETLATSLGEYLARVKGATDLPLAVGFGISTPEHVREIGRVADGAIVASALINYTDGYAPEDQPSATAHYIDYLQGKASL